MDDRNATERSLDLTTLSDRNEITSGCLSKQKSMRQDPVSPRALEKRRRDLINSRLKELSMLIPSTYRKKSKARIEKLEVIEMAIKYIKNLTAKQDKSQLTVEKDEYLTKNNSLSNGNLKNEDSTNDVKRPKSRLNVKDAILFASPRSWFDKKPFQRSASFSCTERIKQEHTKSRERAWTLPLTRYNDTFVFDDLRPFATLGSCKPDTSDRSFKHADGSYKSVLKSMSSLNTSSGNSSIDTGSDNNNGMYKFKNTITKRFFEESTYHSDSSSESSKKSQKRRKTIRKKSRESRSGKPSSLLSPKSPKVPLSVNHKDYDEESEDKSVEMKQYLPGFVLHPAGSHYIPLSIHSSDLGYGSFKTSDEQNHYSGFHPVRILVKFKGSFIHMGIKEKCSANSTRSVSRKKWMSDK